jgi:hypothetical protein
MTALIVIDVDLDGDLDVAAAHLYANHHAIADSNAPSQQYASAKRDSDRNLLSHSRSHHHPDRNPHPHLYLNAIPIINICAGG